MRSLLGRLPFLRTLGRYCLEAYWRLRALPVQIAAWRADRRNRSRYPSLTADDLRRARKSDTVFICGGGASILDITPDEWARMAEHDIVSFRVFPHQRFVRVDYHVSGEIDDVDEYAALINDNPLYDEALFLVQEGLSAHMGNRLIGERKLRHSAPLFRYRRYGRGRTIPFSRDLARGIVHGHGSVVGMVNIAYLLGWKRIVLVGIDLYDHRYFYLPPDETRAGEKTGVSNDSVFVGANRIVEQIGEWSAALRSEGVQVCVQNSRSLLASKIPVFSFPERAGRRAGGKNP